MFGYAFLGEIILYGSVFVALVLFSWWPLIAGIVIAIVLLPYVPQWRAPLSVLSAEEVHRCRRNTLVAFVALLLLVVAAGLSGGR